MHTCDRQLTSACQCEISRTDGELDWEREADALEFRQATLADKSYPLSANGHLALQLCLYFEYADMIVMLRGEISLQVVQCEKRTSAVLDLLARKHVDDPALVAELRQPLPVRTLWRDVVARDDLLRRAEWVANGGSRALVLVSPAAH